MSSFASLIRKHSCCPPPLTHSLRSFVRHLCSLVRFAHSGTNSFWFCPRSLRSLGTYVASRSRLRLARSGAHTCSFTRFARSLATQSLFLSSLSRCARSFGTYVSHSVAFGSLVRPYGRVRGRQSSLRSSFFFFFFP